MKASGAIVVVLVAAVGTLLCTGCHRQRAAAMTLSFSDDGSLLAAVEKIHNKTQGDDNSFRVVVLETRRPEAAKRVIGYCSSSFAAWNGNGDGLYVLQAGGNQDVLAELCLDGRVATRSQALPSDAEATGATLSYDNVAGVVACLQSLKEGQSLVLWWPKVDDIEQVLFPDGFAADLSMPPYVCGNVVVVVSSDGEDFAALDIGGMSWQYASREQRKAGWQMSGGFEKDLFFLDSQAHHLWSMVSELPLGATPTAEGFVVTAFDKLVALDVASQEAIRVLTHRRAPDGPSVFSHLLAGVAGSEDSTTRVVLYNATETPSGPRADCVAYILDTSDPQVPRFREHVVYEDGEVVASAGIAVSRSGQLLALCRAGSDGELFLTVLELPDGKKIASWPVPFGGLIDYTEAEIRRSANR